MKHDGLTVHVKGVPLGWQSSHTTDSASPHSPHGAALVVVRVVLVGGGTLVVGGAGLGCGGGGGGE